MRIIKTPRINGLGNSGSEKAPNLILAELDRLGRPLNLDIEEIHVNNDDVEESERLIYENAKEEFEICDSLIFLGGDHSISFPIVRGFMDVDFENRSQILDSKSRPPTHDSESVNSTVKRIDSSKKFLIVFDAHADCMKPMKEPTHEEWLRGVIDSGFNPENIVLIGCRKIEDVERVFLNSAGVRVFSGDGNMEGIADYVTEKAMGKDVYISIDIDVLDPAFAPGVNYPEPAGLTSKEFFYLLKRIFHLPKIRGLDLVEVVPEKDRGGLTVKTSAKVLEMFLKRDG